MMYLKGQAVDFIMLSNINTFPVDAVKVYVKGCSWSLLHYSHPKALEVFTAFNLMEYANAHKAFAFCTPDSRYFIFFDSRLSFEERNFCIIHEIGHIFLGHTAYCGIVGKAAGQSENNAQEHEADEFARYVLAPECYLHISNIKRADDIAKFAGISLENAIRTAYNLEAIRQLTPKEITLCKKLGASDFNKNIDEYTCMELPLKRRRFNKKSFVLITAALLFLSALFLYFRQANSNKQVSDAMDTQLASSSLGVSAKKNSTKAELMSEDIFYVTKSGQSFHRADCRHIKGRETSETGIEEAIRMGYRKCKDCLPLSEM